MAEAAAPYGRKTQRAPVVKEVDVLWITAGLGCDGDSISITAATQPSIEDVLLSAIPGLPKVNLHNPVLAYDNGDDFLKPWYLAAEGRLEPVHPGRRRLDPQRENQEGRLLGGPRHRQDHRPADPHLHLDRPAGAAGLGGGRRRHLRHLRRHSRHGRQPDRLHGFARLPGLEMAVQGGPAHRLRARLPGAAGQLHGNARSTCSTRRPAWPR